MLISSRLNSGSLCAAAEWMKGDGRWVTAKCYVGTSEKAKDVFIPLTILSHGPIMPKSVTATAFHNTAIFLGNSDINLGF